MVSDQTTANFVVRLPCKSLWVVLDGPKCGYGYRTRFAGTQLWVSVGHGYGKRNTEMRVLAKSGSSPPPTEVVWCWLQLKD